MQELVRKSPVTPRHRALAQATTLTPRLITALALTLAALTMLVTTHPAIAQGEPVIQEVKIGIQDLATKENLGYVQPGEVLIMELGNRYRLRMVAVPAAARRAPRYPSARFSELAGGGRIDLSDHDVRTGSVVVEAISTHHPGNPQATTLIEFEIVEDLNFQKPKLKGGTITVEVKEPEPVPAPEPVDGPEIESGITLYEHQDFRGVSEFFSTDVRDLRGTRIQPDRASSVRIDRGCEAILFEHPDFEGRSTVVTRSIEDLGRERVGNDAVSSIRLDCTGDGFDDRDDDFDRDREVVDHRGGGITVYEHQDFRGDSETFHGDVRDLRGTRIGPDRASSIRIDRDCEAMLYEHPDYQGRSSRVRTSVEDLGDLEVGNDTLSAIRLDCSGHGFHLGEGSGETRGREPVQRLGVTLYDDAGFRGRSQTFTGSIPGLRDTRVGDDRARSVRLDPGCRARLWTGEDYRGESLFVDRDLDDLSRTSIGFDTVSSLEVDCRR